MTVQLSLDSSNVQHERIVLKLVKPEIPNFSITSTDISETIVRQKNPPPCESSCQPERKKAKV